MRVLIVGVDGYIGWSLAMYLAKRGHRVSGIDNGTRRIRVEEGGSGSAIPLPSMEHRQFAFNEANPDLELSVGRLDVVHYGDLCRYLQDFDPQAVVHLGEIPSAPYSMRGYNHIATNYENNVIGTLSLLHAMHLECPNAALVKLGTMGTYGTPNVPIPEGWFDCTIDGHTDRLMFPHKPSSWYHATKCCDSTNVEYACRLWGLAATDIHQGVVYGTRTDEMLSDELRTRFDFDSDFGTAINRFVAQAVIESEITPYGIGGQRRGFIALRDSIQCLTLAIENQGHNGEYRVFNQFEEVYQLDELAALVSKTAKEFGLNPVVRHVDNPRMEAESHFYEPAHKHLLDLGYKPTTDMQQQLRHMIEDLMPHRDRILKYKEAISPSVTWR